MLLRRVLFPALAVFALAACGDDDMADGTDGFPDMGLDGGAESACGAVVPDAVASAASPSAQGPSSSA
ncbi:MAG: hypothetical protein AAGH15_25335 [Myxococcota bacterium]